MKRNYRFAAKCENVTDFIRKVAVSIKEIGIIIFLNSGTQSMWFQWGRTFGVGPGSIGCRITLKAKPEAQNQK